MKVTSIDIHAYTPIVGQYTDKLFTLSFKDTQSRNPYIAKEILGLDAEEISSKFYGSSLFGGNFYELSMTKRDITIQVILNPNVSLGKTYGLLRDELFKLISASRNGHIQLRFNDGLDTVAAVSGFVTKLEAPKFTKTPEVNLTIKCDEPMLKSLTETSVDVNSLQPFYTKVTDEKSTSPHGFKFAVAFTGDRYSFTLQDLAIPTWSFKVDLAGSGFEQFLEGDILYVSSEHNDRSVLLSRENGFYHLADRISPDSFWPLIFPGVNDFFIGYDIEWKYITYSETYWGI